MSGAVSLDHLVGQPNILNYAANQQQISLIDRTGLYDFLQMSMSYTATLAGYTTQPTMVGSNGYEAVLNMIQTVTLTATANSSGATSDTLVNTDLITLAVYQYYYGHGIIPGVPFGTFSNAAFNVSAAVKINFMDPWSTKGGLTRLDSRLLSTLQLSLTWRDPTSFAAGGAGGTATVTNAQVVLTVREWQNVAERIRPYLRLQDRKAPITNQQNALQVQGVPVGQVLRREFLQGIVPQVANYNYGWSSAAAFGSTGQAQGPMWQLRTNNSVYQLNSSLAAIIADNPQLLGVTQNAWGTLSGAIPGWAIFEPSRNRTLGNSIPMWGVQRADDYIDVAAPGTYGSYYKFSDIELVGATPDMLANS